MTREEERIKVYAFENGVGEGDGKDVGCRMEGWQAWTCTGLLLRGLLVALQLRHAALATASGIKVWMESSYSMSLQFADVELRTPNTIIYTLYI